MNTYVHRAEYIKKNNLTEFRKEIVDSVKFTNDLSECIFCILNDITDMPVCECGNPVEFKMFTRGYREYCSVSCRAKSNKWELQKQETNLVKYGVRHVAQQQHERVKRSKMLSSIDRSKWNQTNRSAKFKETILSRYNGINSGWLSNGRLTRLNNGHISKNKEEFVHYRKVVDYLTNKQPINTLKHFDRRNNHCYNDDAYHLDHKVSVLHCFNNNIRPEVCASIHNLQFIPWRENLSKWSKSIMSPNELLELYNESKI